MNLAWCHSAVLLTALGTKLNSSMPSSLSTSISICWHDLYSFVYINSVRTAAFLFFCELPALLMALWSTSEPLRSTLTPGEPGDQTSALELWAPDAASQSTASSGIHHPQLLCFRLSPFISTSLNSSSSHFLREFHLHRCGRDAYSCDAWHCWFHWNLRLRSGVLNKGV